MKPAKKAKMKKVFKEFGEGKLHSGSKRGPIITSDKQATAVAFAEARKVGKKKPSVKKAPKRAYIATTSTA